jgi:hypothetical protein
MRWNYFASGHGKGEVDGAGTFLKRKIHKEQIRPQACKLQNTHVVTFCYEQIGMLVYIYCLRFGVNEIKSLYHYH